MTTHRVFLMGAAFVFALNAGCATRPRPGEGSSLPDAKTEAQQKKQEAREAMGRPAPTGSPLSKIQEGMNDLEVRKLIGEPDDATGYITGKSFIPYYFGPDTSRMEWIYKGQGRVVFTRNQWSGNLKVIRVDYNPNEGK